MQVFKDHRAFFTFYFTFLIVAGYMIFKYSKASIHIYFNQFNSPFWDKFFKYWTHLGDGWTLGLVGLVFLLFVSKRSGLFIWSSGILSGLLSQGMKHWLFGKTPRPYKYFTEVFPYDLHYVEGVDMNMVNSLPSGHTSAAFALCFTIAMIFPSRKLDTSMFILAMSIGWSRIYLSQHFLEDVFLGSIVGILSTIIIHSWIFSPKLLEKNGLSRPIISRS